MLDGKVGFHSGSCLEGRPVRLRVPSTRDFEAITIALDRSSPFDFASGCSQARRL